jgi:hypothetical protein
MASSNLKDQKANLENNIQLPTSCKIYIKNGNGQSGQWDHKSASWEVK